MEFLIQISLSFMAIFIILLVLVQRGKGGGLAGALGGPGGSSAFGAKAGDTFMWITIWTVFIWLVLCLLANVWANNRGDALDTGETAKIQNSAESVEPGIGAVAGTEEADAEQAGTEDEAAAEGDATEAAASEESTADEAAPEETPSK